jgi:hypothetical protein
MVAHSAQNEKPGKLRGVSMSVSPPRPIDRSHLYYRRYDFPNRIGNARDGLGRTSRDVRLEAGIRAKWRSADHSGFIGSRPSFYARKAAARLNRPSLRSGWCPRRKARA